MKSFVFIFVLVLASASFADDPPKCQATLNKKYGRDEICKFCQDLVGADFKTCQTGHVRHCKEACNIDIQLAK